MEHPKRNTQTDVVRRGSQYGVGTHDIRHSTRRAFLKTPENFSGPKTLRGAFRVFFSGPEKCFSGFSEHPKVSRIVSRYFRESFRVRAGKIILEHGFL